uniref:Protein V2 n=1 Tax=Begomovirus alternantherae TaxID=337826 RepID=A0A1S7FQ67_9GEMI|nr:AV2 protein [Alternanthera yellow vein virus]
MWDPLLNPFPQTVHGFRCMLSVKYLQAVEEIYAPDTLGADLIRELIQVIRASNYVEACSRYDHFIKRIEGTTSSQLRQPYCSPCYCPPDCPCHSKTAVVEPSHVSQAKVVPNVQ